MKSSKNGLLRKGLLGLALMVLMVLLSSSCGGSDVAPGGGSSGGDGSGGGELDGTWVWSGQMVRSVTSAPEGRATMEFNSNQFTLTVDHFEFTEGHAGFTSAGALFYAELMLRARREDRGRVFVGGFDGGRHYTITETGTFALTDDRIELVFSDGTIDVFDFSRTPSTFDISMDRTNVGAVAPWEARFILQS